MRSNLYVSFFAATSALVPLTLAAPTANPSNKYGSMKVLSSRTDEQDALWVAEQAQSKSEEKVQFSIKLRAKDQEAADTMMAQIADPTSDRYQQYLSAQEAEDLTRAHEDGAADVHAYLADFGASNIQGIHGNRTITFEASVAVANKLFNADYKMHSSAPGADGRAQKHRLSKSVSLPESFHQHVWGVHPGTHVRMMRAHHRKADSKGPLASASSLAKRADPKLTGIADCNGIFTPACVRATYNLPDANVTSQFAANVSVGVINFRPDCSNKTDIQRGLALTSPHIPSSYQAESHFINVHGVQVDQCTENDEANLDLQALMPIVYPMKVYDFEGPALTDEAIFGAIANIGTGNIPRPDVLSVSYGSSAPTAFADVKDVCALTNALALQGTTLLASSGDSGSQLSSYPCACPGWTCVGATQTAPGASVHDVQTSQDFNNTGGIDFHGGGGFTPDQPAPDYQKAALASYAAQYIDPVFGKFQQNRAFPDLGAQGQNYPVVVDGILGGIGGTSLSSPMIASLLALMNSELKQAGKPLLGSVAPLFYANPGLFRDVTLGSNFDKSGFSTSKSAYPAKHGWDASTGLGTLMYDRLAALVLGNNNTTSPVPTSTTASLASATSSSQTQSPSSSSATSTFTTSSASASSNATVVPSQPASNATSSTQAGAVTQTIVMTITETIVTQPTATA